MSGDSENIANRQTEALKALADWSKWLIVVETTISGFLIASHLDDPFVLAALISFFVSILAATLLMGAIPAALQKVPHKDGIYWFLQFSDRPRLPSVPIVYFAAVEHIFAGVGFTSLLIFCLGKLLAPS